MMRRNSFVLLCPLLMACSAHANGIRATLDGVSLPITSYQSAEAVMGPGNKGSNEQRNHRDVEPATIGFSVPCSQLPDGLRKGGARNLVITTADDVFAMDYPHVVSAVGKDNDCHTKISYKHLTLTPIPGGKSR